MEIPCLAALRKSRATLVTTDTDFAAVPSVLKLFPHLIAVVAMKAFKSLLRTSPRSSSKTKTIPCKWCQKKFKPAEPGQAYCSLNCLRSPAWAEINAQHSEKLRRHPPSPPPDLDSVIKEALKFSPNRPTFDSSDPYGAQYPQSVRNRTQSSFQLLHASDEPGPSLIRKRSMPDSRHAQSSRSYSPLPPLPSSPEGTPVHSLESLPSSPSSASSSGSDFSYRESYNTDVRSFLSNPEDLHSPAPIERSSLSSPNLLQRPRAASARYPLSNLAPAGPRPAAVSPFLTRKPSHPLSFSKPPRSPTSQSTTEVPANPHPRYPDNVLRLRPDFAERRAPRPRSNSFGGFQSAHTDADVPRVVAYVC